MLSGIGHTVIDLETFDPRELRKGKNQMQGCTLNVERQC